MHITIETPRLLIRPVLEQDLEGFFEMDSNPKVHLYLGNQPSKTLDDSKNTISMIRNQYIENGIGRMSVIEKETQKFIGWAGLKLITETVNGRSNFYDIGYRLVEGSWGKGYATEAAKAMLSYAFNEMALETVYAIADCKNSASNHVLKKIGLTYIESFDFEETPHNWYQISRTDWNKRQ